MSNPENPESVIRASEVWFGVSRSQTALMPDDHRFETRKKSETRKFIKLNIFLFFFTFLVTPTLPALETLFSGVLCPQ